MSSTEKSKQRLKYYTPVPDEEKKVSGRPRKYNRKTIIDDEGNERIVLEELDRHRFFFVSYNFSHLNSVRWGYITFTKTHDEYWNIADLQKITGLTNIIPIYSFEFKDKKDFLEFQRKDKPDFEVLD